MISQMLFVPLALLIATMLAGCAVSDLANQAMNYAANQLGFVRADDNPAIKTLCDACDTGLDTCPTTCQGWLDAGANCDDSWNGICGTDHPSGAEFNDDQLKDTGADYCSPCSTAEGQKTAAFHSLCVDCSLGKCPETCQAWLDKGATCADSWSTLCSGSEVDHPQGAQYNSDPLSSSGAAFCPPCSEEGMTSSEYYDEAKDEAKDAYDEALHEHAEALKEFGEKHDEAMHEHDEALKESAEKR
eukprot:CAMPEP_0197650704 /NCGR_PEP_ID=MMETSP1338-20131121/31102_1 /TAXON_ID=43686 ORGANISM="Pelagodinium beii, Strain RCC1491" /NCGR_SAMPLE_ID=MMETSP1338 /ASSEMBLY_ACC=CAM_ASM_000754 /LENGTH=243 /DNA_ID=CAMNT_0043225161 /DNA_START=68 /DNA_END=799 /DNA_ORIENTATION=+